MVFFFLAFAYIIFIKSSSSYYWKQIDMSERAQIPDITLTLNRSSNIQLEELTDNFIINGVVSNESCFVINYSPTGFALQKMTDGRWLTWAKEGKESSNSAGWPDLYQNESRDIFFKLGSIINRNEIEKNIDSKYRIVLFYDYYENKGEVPAKEAYSFVNIIFD